MLGHHLLLLLHVPLAHAAAADDETFVVWASSPTLPGETAVLQTAQQAADLQLCSGGNCSEIALEQAWARGAKFSVPTDLKLAVWSISSGGRQLATINSAEPWWSICDRRVGNSASVPTECAPGASSLRVFGRALAFSADTCVRYNESLVHAAAAAATKLQLSDDSGTAIELGASEASCYTAEFELPGNLPPGTYSWSVKNNLDGADFSRVLEDLQQRTIAVHASTTPTVAAMHTPAIVPAGNVPALLAAVHSAKAGMTVMLPAGTWKMGALDRITVPDGVALRGAGSDATMLRWPTQTGAMCASFKRVNFGGPGLISGDDAGSTLGWSVSDLQIRVDGGLQQNDTVAGGQHAYCPIVTTQSKQYGKTTRGMVLENLVIHSVAPTGVSGVDMQAGGVGMGPAVSIGGSDHAIKNCSIIHLGDCGSNVTPLLSIGSSRTIISNNTFSFGCTLYAMHSVQSLLWERNTASNFTNLGRDGSVIGTFGPPFIAEHISFLGNSQVDNAKSPPGIVPVAKGGSCNGPVNVCANHRLETLTLDGGGGAYTGYVARASGLEVTLAADPFLNGSGSYIPYNDMVQSSWAGAAAMILSGPGAGQWRHITNHTGRIWRVDRPWSVQPDTNSKLQISPQRGHILLVGNSWKDGFTVQLYAQCLSSVVAENVLDSTPLISWGRNPHNWGYQPNWRIEIIDNQHPHSAGLTVQTSDQVASCDGPASICAGNYSWIYNGPLGSGIAIRRNWINGSGIRIFGTASDVLVERNTVSQESGRSSHVGYQPIEVENTTTNILQRDNKLF